jgi:hypothetical protein
MNPQDPLGFYKRAALVVTLIVGALLLTACPDKRPSTPPPSSMHPVSSITSTTVPLPGLTFTLLNHNPNNDYFHPGSLYLQSRGSLEAAVCAKYNAALAMFSGKVEASGIKNGVNFKAEVIFPSPPPDGARIEFVQYVKHWVCYEYAGGQVKCTSAMDKWCRDQSWPWANDEDKSAANIRYLEDSPGIPLPPLILSESSACEAIGISAPSFSYYTRNSNGSDKIDVIGRIKWRVKLGAVSNAAGGWDFETPDGSTGSYDFVFAKWNWTQDCFPIRCKTLRAFRITKQTGP